jgi:hypothetical protein
MSQKKKKKKKPMACSLLNSGPDVPFFALGDCGLFHYDEGWFVSGS